jgi:hypothetical protein
LNGAIGVYWAAVPSTMPASVPGVKPGAHSPLASLACT